VDNCLRRRDFIKVIGGTAAAWPVTARGPAARTDSARRRADMTRRERSGSTVFDMHNSANAHHGQPRNPYDINRVTGGSSSGASGHVGR
jgi:hypothetical protein